MPEAVISCMGGAMGKEDVRLKTYLEDTRRYADLWNGSVFKGRQKYKEHDSKKRAGGERGKSMFKALDDLIADGKAEGKAEFIIELLEEYGKIPDKLKKRIYAQNDLLLLSNWHKIAAHVNSIEEFICQTDC